MAVIESTLRRSAHMAYEIMEGTAFGITLGLTATRVAVRQRREHIADRLARTQLGDELDQTISDIDQAREARDPQLLWKAKRKLAQLGINGLVDPLADTEAKQAVCRAVLRQEISEPEIPVAYGVVIDGDRKNPVVDYRYADLVPPQLATEARHVALQYGAIHGDQYDIAKYKA